jgi:hypothetical protein
MNFNDFWAMFFVAGVASVWLYLLITNLLNLFFNLTQHYD